MKTKNNKGKRPKLAPAKATFIESMECLAVASIPEGPEWTYEIKLDGYRLEAVKHSGVVTLYSRRKNVLNEKFQYIADALKTLPDNTVIDGEVVALDESGRSDFNLLQNFVSAATQIHYYVFDVLFYKGKLLTGKPLSERRALLEKITSANEHISLSSVDTSASHLLKFVKEHGLEGIVAKRADGVYEPGKRSGLWRKHRINQGQEFVVGGYTPGNNGFDAIVIGVYKAKQLHFSARVRAGFVPATRREVFKRVGPLKTDKCPFVNLPEKSAGRWGQGLTADKMKECIWVTPKVVVRIEFLEWTGGDKLRHTRFVGLREDKDPRKVVRESPDS